MSRTVKIEIYEIDELEGSAKEHALAKERELTRDDIVEVLLEYFQEKVQEAGYPTEDIRYSLSNCQGDGVAFYSGKLFDCTTVLKRLELIPQDYAGVTYYAQIINMNLRCHHYNSMIFEPSDCDGVYSWKDEWIEKVKEDIKSLSIDLEREGYSIIERAETEEKMVESANERGAVYLSNGVEFDEDKGTTYSKQ
jgi:hypothetical protein